MSDTEPVIKLRRTSASSRANVVPLHKKRLADMQISFNRHELRVILSAYGQRVATGEWRDYAIDMLPESAVFSIFRRASEMPLYRIEKRPKMARKQGLYWVLNASGMVLKRGHDLEQVLRVIEKKPKLALV